MSAADRDGDQPELVPGMVRATVKQAQAKARATRERKAAAAAVTDVDPVARVLLDLPLAHLDRPFDFAVPAAVAQAARPGVRVKVRFAGQEADGYLLERLAESDHPGVLQPLRRVVSPEPVLTTRVSGWSRPGWSLVAARPTTYPPTDWPAKRSLTRAPGTAVSAIVAGTA